MSIGVVQKGIPLPDQAMKLISSNVDDFCSWLEEGGFPAVAPKDPVNQFILVEQCMGDDVMKMIRYGTWIIQHEDGDLSVYDNDGFKSNFITIPNP